MKTKNSKALTILILSVTLMLLLCWATVSQAAPLGTAFTYQGRLMEDDIPADGLYDFQFSLFDDPNTETGNQLVTAIDIDDLDVVDGYFTAELDFGSYVFYGDALWLEIAVAQSNGNEPNDFVALTPRQELTPTPYAIRAYIADSALNGVIGDGTTNRLAKFTGTRSLGDSEIYETAGNIGIGTLIPAEKLAVSLGSGGGDIASFSAFGNNRYMISIDGVDTSLAAQSGNNLKLGTAFSGTSMTILNSTGNVGIGTPSPAEKLDVNGTVKAAAFVGDGSGLTNLPIGSDSDWTISGSDMYSAVSGNVGIGTTAPGAKLDVVTFDEQGGAATIGSSTNSATGDYAVAMGYNTTADGLDSTAMGSYTTANGLGSTAMGHLTIAGGSSSTAMGYYTAADGHHSTAMGHFTTASGESSTAMGYGATASGESSTAMGRGTTADGLDSTAMGYGTIASGGASTTMGRFTTASGDCSTAIGRNIEAAGDYSIAIALADMEGVQVTQHNTMAILGGNVGIKTTSPQSSLHIAGKNWDLTTTEGDFKIGDAAYRLKIGVAIDGAGAGNAYMRAVGGTNGLHLGSGTQNVMTIKNNKVGIGTTNPVYTLHVSGDIAYTGSIYDISDFRLKENITPLENGVEKVSCLKGIYFNNKGESSGKREVGVIAQDVEQVLPELVSTDEQGYKSVDYTKLSAVLIEAVKEQQKQIENLQAEIKALQTMQQHQLAEGKEAQR